MHKPKEKVSSSSLSNRIVHRLPNKEAKKSHSNKPVSKTSKSKKTNPVVNINLSSKKEASGNTTSSFKHSAVDQFLKNFAQAVIFKTLPSTKKEDIKLFGDDSQGETAENTFTRLIKHNPKLILDVIKDLSMRNNFKIKDFGGNKYELARENMKIICEVVSLNIRDPKELRFTYKSGSRLKCSEYVNRILIDIELLEKSKQYEKKGGKVKNA